MKLHWTIALAALLMLPAVVGAQEDASAGLARAYEAGKHGLGSVRWTINNGIGDRPAGALGICIGVDEQEGLGFPNTGIGDIYLFEPLFDHGPVVFGADYHHPP